MDQTKQSVTGSYISAFIIAAGGALTASLAAGNGKLNATSIALIVAAGATSAAKDYRSSMRIPPEVDVPIKKLFDAIPPDNADKKQNQ